MLNSLERIMPHEMADSEITGQETLLLHLERYHYAGKHLVQGTVADVACGVGYGSYLLATKYSQRVTRIIAVDIDAGCIEYARLHYYHEKIDFMVANAATVQCAVTLNNIVSLETIEHLPEPEKFIRHMAVQLVTGGRFIASAPVTPSMDANPYHLHDFTVSRFKKMFTDAGLHEIHSFIQVQPYRLPSLLSRREQRSKHLRKNIAGYYFRHPGKLLLRFKSLLTDGLANKYLVTVFEK